MMAQTKLLSQIEEIFLTRTLSTAFLITLFLIRLFLQDSSQNMLEMQVVFAASQEKWTPMFKGQLSIQWSFFQSRPMYRSNLTYR